MTKQPADVVRPLRQTRQIREFEPTPLAAHVLDALADVARWTGSSENSQPWQFIVITDPATLRALHDAGLPQTRGLATATAAIAIVLPDDPARAVADAYDDGRVAERILVAAQMLDIGAGISLDPAERPGRRPRDPPAAGRSHGPDDRPSGTPDGGGAGAQERPGQGAPAA